MTIYGLECECHPDAGIRYIGQTRRGLTVRLGEHLSAARVGKELPVHKWIRKHGAQVQIVALQRCGSQDELNAEEARLISIFRERGAKLLNVMAGGLVSERPEAVRLKIAMTRLSRGFSVPDIADQVVVDIHAAYMSGEAGQHDLAARYGVSQSTVSSILSRKKRWGLPLAIVPTRRGSLRKRK